MCIIDIDIGTNPAMEGHVLMEQDGAAVRHKSTVSKPVFGIKPGTHRLATRCATSELTGSPCISMVSSKRCNISVRNYTMSNLGY